MLGTPWYRWPIEIDGLPFLKMVDLSMAMLNSQRVLMFALNGKKWGTCRQKWENMLKDADIMG